MKKPMPNVKRGQLVRLMEAMRCPSGASVPRYGVVTKVAKTFIDLTIFQSLDESFDPGSEDRSPSVCIPLEPLEDVRLKYLWHGPRSTADDGEILYTSDDGFFPKYEMSVRFE